MIPKIIHFVWVGDTPKSTLAKKCISSWEKFCPDYQIMEWGNECLKEIDNDYVNEAFQCKKWAFVSDYLRLYALNKFGGIYCDYEIYNNKYSYSTALIGAKKGNKIIQDLLDTYKNIHFINNGEMDMTPNPARFEKYFISNFNCSKIINPSKNKKLTKTEIIYPVHFFCKPKIGFDNFAVHHFDASWFDYWVRKDKFKIGKYSLVSIKIEQMVRDKKRDILPPLPLFENEKKFE